MTRSPSMLEPEAVKPLTEAELSEILARCREATPGPWDFSQCGDVDHSSAPSEAPDLDFVIVNAPDSEGGWDIVSGVFREDCGDSYLEVARNFHFIAHARCDVPRLLETVRCLRVGNAALADEVERLRAGGGR